MARPSADQWKPLGLSADPVPGNPGRISQEAAHLATVAKQISDQVAALRKIGAGGADAALKGQYADQIHSSASDLADQLDKVVGRYQKVSTALNGWIPELEQAQTWSVQALNQAEVPSQKLNQAVVLPSGSNLNAQQQQAVTNYHTSMKTAQGELDAAKALLNKATSLRDNSGSSTASKINSAIDDGVKDSWWDSFKEWVSHYSWVISDVCTVLEILATAAAIIAFVLAQFVPGLDVLVDALVVGAFWATLAAATGRLLLAATGNGSWWDFALDAFACLTFGLGRFVGAGLKMLSEGSALTSKAMMATELTEEALGGQKAVMLAKYAGLMGEDVADVADRIAPKMVSAITDGGELSGMSKFFSSLGALSKEGEGAAKILALGERFAGSAADYSNLAKLGLGVMGTSAGVAGLTGLGSIAAGGIELDGPNGPTGVNWHIPGVSSWYHSTFETPTGAPAGG